MPDSRLILVLGGARSGKSRHAEDMVSSLPAPWIYLATAQAFDDEMHERICEHRMRRNENWRTVEAPLELPEALSRIESGAPVLVDCLTLWLSNHMLIENDIGREMEKLLAVLKKRRGPCFIVSNEVGSGIVPENALSRRFRDAQGRLNQQIAAVADEVILMVAGLPMKVK